MSSNNDLFKVLSEEGVLISFRMGFYRGRKKLRPDDVGLPNTDEVKKQISLGQARLLSLETLSPMSTIESRTRSYLDSNTFPFLGGMAKFAHNSKLKELQSTLDSYREAFHEARDKFGEDYAELIDSSVATWKELAPQICKLDPDTVAEAIRESFPSRADALARFHFSVNYFNIAVPENIEAAKLADAANASEVYEARQRACKDAQSQIRSEAHNFAQECVLTLRKQTRDLCVDVLAQVKASNDGAGVNQKTLNRLTNFMDHFKTMNFMGDTQMGSVLDTARKELLEMSAADYRKGKGKVTDLTKGLEALGAEAAKLVAADISDLVSTFGGSGKRKLT